MAQNTTNNLQPDTDAASKASNGLKSRLDGVAEQGAALASDAVETVREHVAPLQEAGQEYAERLYDVGHQKAQEAAYYAELGYEETRGLVRDYPIQAMAIAAGVGVLIGLLIARPQRTHTGQRDGYPQARARDEVLDRYGNQRPKRRLAGSRHL
jgi:ElaB/YqjD/DUF883 family membrane-anchored ribosome-binding protein